ncbi:hypothetical protein EVAR_68351_1 [Eumeta japonica]|uniref:Uncharacterized protein n=1 Tax=Eumeta variegata TaxID=151549 RepID=A0A4C1SIL3_EUMVA|nr:hypothetical protein EVAR_68351_1 [Eumeta japonica]
MQEKQGPYFFRVFNKTVKAQRASGAWRARAAAILRDGWELPVWTSTPRDLFLFASAGVIGRPAARRAAAHCLRVIYSKVVSTTCLLYLGATFHNPNSFASAGGPTLFAVSIKGGRRRAGGPLPTPSTK